MVSDTEIYKNTYAQLVKWVKELLRMRRDDATIYDRNIRQARRIMELEFDLRRYSVMMVEDKQETIMKDFAEAEVVSLEEFRKNHPKPMGGGSPPSEGDWLSPMVWGTEFRVSPKMQKTWLLMTFTMAGVRNGTVLVIPHHGDEISQDTKEWMWVNPLDFCKFWDKIAVILIPEEIETDE